MQKFIIILTVTVISIVECRKVISTDADVAKVASPLRLDDEDISEEILVPAEQVFLPAFTQRRFAARRNAQAQRRTYTSRYRRPQRRKYTNYPRYRTYRKPNFYAKYYG